MHYCSQALHIGQVCGNKVEAGKARSNIAIIYNEQGNNTKAVEYYKQTLAAARDVGDMQLEAKDCLNIAVAYRDRATLPKLKNILVEL